MNILCIDPGKDTGLALFGGGQLMWCGLTDGDFPKFQNFAIDRVVIEEPNASDQRCPLQDLIKLGIRAGRLSALYPAPTKWYLPSTWKGSIPKDKHHPRILAKLSPLERKAFDDCRNVNTGRTVGAKIHNVIDAIGIGLYELRR